MQIIILQLRASETIMLQKKKVSRRIVSPSL